jgi:hypothetical protein
MTISQNFPSIAPSLSLNFASSRTLDPRITFTRTSSATCVGPNGLLRVVPANAPRFDHNPLTGESLGLLMEEQRTNLLARSEDYSDIIWLKSGSSISADVTEAPNGAITADKLVEDSSAANFHRVINVSLFGIDFSSGLVFTIFVRAGERTRFRLYIYNNDNTSNFVQGDFNLASLTTTASTGGSASSAASSITAFRNGWYRCQLSGTPDPGVTSGVPNIQLRMLNAVGSEAYTGDGTSGLFLWGAQLEAGAFPTSYIPTTAAAVTRTFDVASISGSNFSSWYRQDEGSIFAEVSYSGQLIGSAAGTNDIAFSDGTGQNFYDIRVVRAPTNPQADIVAVSGGIGQLDTGGLQPVLPNVMYKRAFSYATNNAVIYINGLIDTGVFTSYIPASINRLVFGNSSFRMFHIKRLVYYSKRLPNAQLINLTK